MFDPDPDYYADYLKVSCATSHVMHIAYYAGRRQKTLCGVEWVYHNDHGELYCRKCQRALAKRLKAKGIIT